MLMSTKICSVLHGCVRSIALVALLCLPFLSVTAFAAMSAPTSVSVSGLTPTSGTLQWEVTLGSRHDYDIIVSTSQLASSVLGNATTPCTVTAATPGVVVFANAVSLGDATTYALTGLTGGAHYYVYIRQNGTAQYEDHSAWVTYEFSTPCEATSVLPVLADFDGGNFLPSCWSAGAKSPTFSASVHHDSGNSMSLSATAQEGCFVYSPVFASNAHAYNLTAAVYGAAGATYRIGVAATADLLTIEPVLEGEITVANTWQLIDAVVPAELQAELEQGIEYVWVIYNAAADDAKTFYIDDVKIDEIPTCLSPADLTVTGTSDVSLILNWTERGTATSWVVEYTTDGETLTAAASAVPFTLTGLAPTTAYSIRVKAVCSASDQSDWSQPVTAQTVCSPAPLPYSENFDGETEHVSTTTSRPSLPAYPACWTILNESNSSSAYPQAFLTSNPSYNVEGQSFFVKMSNSTPLVAVLPNVTVDPSTLLMVEFSYRNEGTSDSNGHVQLGYVTNAADASSFVQLVEYDQVTEMTAVEEVLSLPANALIAFRFQGGSSSNYYASIDNVVVKVAPSCVKPHHFHFVSATTNEATFAWTTASETSWELTYQLNGGEPQTVVVNNTPQYTITGLLPATTYALSASLRAICSATDSSEVAVFANQLFATECGTMSLPFSQNFDAINSGIPACWDNDNGTTDGYYRWSYYADGYTGAGVRFDSYMNSTGLINDLITPAINVGNATQIAISFMYKNPSGGEYDVFLSHDGGETFTDTLAANLSASVWTEFTAELAVAANENIALAFHGVSNYGSGDAYLYLDDVDIAVPGGCARPNAVTAAAMSATEVAVEITDNNPAHTAWEIVVVAQGADPDGATPVAVTEKLVTVEASLVSGTLYEVYVRTVCGADDKSAFRGPAVFTYVDYSTVTDLPLQGVGEYPWTIIEEDGITKLQSTNQDQHSTSSEIEATVVVPAGVEASVSFNYFAQSESTSYDYLCLYIDQTNPSSSNYDAGFGKKGGTTGETGTYTTPFLSEGMHKLRWRYIKDSSVSDGADAAQIWNITLNTNLFWAPKNFELVSVAANTATVSWTQCPNVDKNEVKLDSTVYETATNSITLSDLASATVYYMQVRSIVGNDTTAWSAPFSFRTDCADQSIPFAESFENEASELCWKIVGNAVTLSAANDALDGERSAVVVCDSVAGLFVSPRFDVPSLAEYEVSLAIKLSNVRYQGALKPLTIGVMTDPNDVSTYIDLGDIVIPSAGSWKEYRFSLADLATSDYAEWAAAQYVVVSLSDSATYYFDAISVATAADCPKPTALNAQADGEDIVITWVSDAAAHYAEIALGDSVVFAGDVQSPFVPQTLMPNTYYKVRVRANCGEDTSEWTPWANFKTPCSFTTLPYSENFDSYTGVSVGSTRPANAVMPDCWDWVGDDVVYCLVGSNSSYSVSGKSLHFRAYNSGATVDYAYALLPAIATGDVATQMSLYYRYESSSSGGDLVVGYLTAAGDVSSFVPVRTLERTTTMTEAEINFPAMATLYAAYRYEKPSSSYWDASVDNVTVIEAPSCIKPTGLQISALTADSATIAWTAGGSETSWELVYQFGAVSDTVVVNDVPNFTVKNLLPSTDYTFTVVSLTAICSESDSSLPVSATLNFTTPCAVEILPYDENFADGIGSCWTRYTGLLFADGVSTASASPSTSGWNVPSTKVFADGEVKLNIYGESCKSWIVSPSFLVSDAQATLSFDIALTLYNNTNPVTAGGQADDKFIVAFSTDGNTWHLADATVWSNQPGADYVYDSISAAGNHYEMSLSAYVGQTLKVAFYGESTVSGGDNDLHLSNIYITQPVECARPASVAVTERDATSATLAINDPEGTAWEYVINNVEAEPVATGQNIVLTDLTPQTVYTVYVRRVCGENSVSAWRSVTFKTDCGAVTAINEGFEDYGSSDRVPDCWTLMASNSTYYPYIYNYGAATGSNCLYAYGYAGSYSGIVALPQIDGDLSRYQLRLKAKTSSTSSGDSPIFVIVSNTTDYDAMVEDETSYEIINNGHPIVPTLNYQEYTVSLEGYAGEGQYVLLYLYQLGSSVYIDDVVLDLIPDCNYPQAVSASGATATSVDVLITDASAEHNAWEVVVVNHGDAPTEGTPVVVNSKAATVTGTFVSGTQYDVYVRTVCGENEYSAYCQPATFRYVDYSAATDLPIQAVGDYPWTVNSENHLESTNQGVPSSESDLLVTFVVPEGSLATVSFQYYASSESATFDYLSLYIDEKNPSTSNYDVDFGRKGGPSGETGTYEFNLAAGTHQVLWRYRKDGSIDGGEDLAQVWDIQVSYNTLFAPINLAVEDVSPNSATLTWDACGEAILNEVHFTSDMVDTVYTTEESYLFVTDLLESTPYQFAVRSFTASDTTEWSAVYRFTTPLTVAGFEVNLGEGDYPWEVITEDGITKLQSTNQGVASSSSDMTTTVVVGEDQHGTLSFNYFASSESASFDYLCLYVDQANPNSSNFLSDFGAKGGSEGDAGVYSLDLPTGTHTIRWRYTKDGSIDGGLDLAQVWGLSFRSVSIVYADTIFDEVCDGGDYEGNGFSLTDSQLRPGVSTFQYTRPAATDLEADTVYTLRLTVHEASYTYFTDTVCAHEHYTGYGFDIADVDPLRVIPYTRHLENQFGCDSTISLTLFVPQTEYAETKHLCEGDSYTFGDSIITTSGVYVHTFQSQFGCDSTITLQIFFHATSASLEANLCAGETYEFGDQVLTEAGTYYETFTNAAGCDSVVTLTLNILQPIITNIDGVFCEGTTFAGGSISPKFMDLNVEGIYTDTLKSAAGCDSILVLNLVEEKAQHTAVEGTYSDGKPFVYNGHSYQEDGTFEIILTTVNGCDSIITLTVKKATALDNLELGNLAINPNPVHVGEEAVIRTDIAFTDDYVLRVYDAVGRLVAETTEQNGRVPALPVAGIYTVRVSAASLHFQTKLIVK